MKRKKNPWETISSTINDEINHLKKMKKQMKLKILFTVVLPVFAVVLAVQVFKTFLQIKLREITADSQTIPEDSDSVSQ